MIIHAETVIVSTTRVQEAVTIVSLSESGDPWSLGGRCMLWFVTVSGRGVTGPVRSRRVLSSVHFQPV